MATQLQPAFILPTHGTMFRTGEVARITGIGSYTPPGLACRVVYEVEYADGRQDLIPVEPAANYRLLTVKEVAFAGR